MPTGHKNRFVLPVLLFLASFALLGIIRVHASPEDKVDQAVAASKTWVTQIDSGKYDDSYNFACQETRTRYAEDHWIDVMKTLRTPWGAVLDRHQLSHVYMPNGYKGLEGECMVVTYNTNFKNLSNASEKIVLKWEDGQWRGAGYFAGPTPDPNAVPSTPNYQTDVQTDPHAQAPPQ